MYDPYPKRVDQEDILNDFTIMPCGYTVPYPFSMLLPVEDAILSIPGLEGSLEYQIDDDKEDSIPLELIGCDENGLLLWRSTEDIHDELPTIYRSVHSAPIGAVIQALVLDAWSTGKYHAIRAIFKDDIGSPNHSSIVALLIP